MVVRKRRPGAQGARPCPFLTQILTQTSRDTLRSSPEVVDASGYPHGWTGRAGARLVPGRSESG